MITKISKIWLLVFVCSAFLAARAQGELNIYDPNWTIATEAGCPDGIQAYNHYGIQGYKSETFLVWGLHYIRIPLSAYQTVGIFAVLICGCAYLLIWLRRISRKNAAMLKNALQ
jgi:hypothetical protein